MKQSRQQRAESRIKVGLFNKGFLISAFCSLLSAFSSAADPTAPRLFFSDARISFSFPNHWDLQQKFPYGPLFTKTTRYGDTAMISCAISAPLDSNRISSEISQEVLKQLAKRELAANQPSYKTIEEKDRVLSGHPAFQITWDNIVSSQSFRHQTVYFYVEGRVYALSLQSPAKTFRWAVGDYQNWLKSLRILSRKESGALSDPAHGGLWIHQTAGAKIAIPGHWLIAVADDRMLGAAYVRGNFHTELTATVDAASVTARDFSARDRKEAIKAIRKKGLRIVRESESAFHGFPAFQVQYEGQQKERVIKGTDIWVLTPKGRWLFNVEGDVSLYNSLTEEYNQILGSIEFI